MIASIYDNLGGGTNWDGGLQLAATSFDPNPHLVVFITDGNPTANNLAGGADKHRRGQLGRLHGGRDLGQPAESR